MSDFKHSIDNHIRKQPSRVVSSVPPSRTELQDEQCCGQSNSELTTHSAQFFTYEYDRCQFLGKSSFPNRLAKTLICRQMLLVCTLNSELSGSTKQMESIYNDVMHPSKLKCNTLRAQGKMQAACRSSYLTYKN